MRTKTARILVFAVALAALAVPAASLATGHCPSTLGGSTDVIIFSGTNGLIVNPGIAGCVVDPADPTFDTDFIVPGSRQLQVRWLQDTQPVAGTLTVNGIQIGSCGQGGTQVPGGCSLRFTATPSGTTRIWDSQIITVVAQTTLTSGTATAYVCLAGTQTACTESQSHTYRTVA